MNKDEILTWLARRGRRRNVEGMGRYGIHSARVFGVSLGTMRPLAKRLGKDHALAMTLWNTGWLEARVLAALVDDPRRVTRRQMNVWAAEFDNWAVCDAVCGHLFDRTPFAWEKARQWADSPREFVKRAAFTLIASLAVHEKAASDARFVALLPLIEQGAHDTRNFVKKGVNWALRQIGKRNLALHAAALAVAKRLSESQEAACRWVGLDALRELASPQVRARLARRKPPATVSRRETGR
jgi:3-methyladenine DNA glycosylase AlkD